MRSSLKEAKQNFLAKGTKIKVIKSNTNQQGEVINTFSKLTGKKLEFKDIDQGNIK